MPRSHRLAMAALLVLALGACAAPAPQAQAGAAQNAAQATEPAPVSPPSDAQSRPARPPRMSDPLPPQRMPTSAPVAVDQSCRTDADCAVKDVGSCCGYQPACVNKDSPTDPAAVRAQCQRQGMASICGFREIGACTCNAGRCEAAGADTPVAR